MSRSASILLLAPQLYGAPGGIQVYMRRLREILTMYGEIRGYQLHSLSLVDVEEQKDLHHRSVEQGVFVGCRGKKVLFTLRAICTAWRYPADLVIVGHIGQVPVAWLMRKLGLIQSYILVLYGLEAWKRAEWFDMWGVQGATCIVAITKHTAQEFCKRNGVPLNRVQVIPPTLAEEKIEVPCGGQGLRDSLSILTVGRLSAGEYKGIDTLINAVERARSKGAKVHLDVVGDGDDLPRLLELVSGMNLNGCVAFLGAISDESLQQRYQECDVFAMPSKWEGFGIVFLEAMRYGKPCIGGNHGGTPEVIAHGVDGYLVDHGNVERLADYLIEFSSKPGLRGEMGLRGHEKVRAEYLFWHMRANWFSLLDGLLTG